jgi:hypothetical protein
MNLLLRADTKFLQLQLITRLHKQRISNITLKIPRYDLVWKENLQIEV